MARNVIGDIGTGCGVIEILQELIDNLVILDHLLLIFGASIEEEVKFLIPMRLLIIWERVIILKCCKYSADLHDSRQ